MWVLVVLCFALVFIITVIGQLSVFNMSVTELITFKRVTDENS